MKLTKEDLKYPQIDAAFRYIYDNHNKYKEKLDVYEFGIYNGNSLKKIASYCNYLLNKPSIYAYDSFEGLPKENKVFDKFQEGMYTAWRSPSEIVSYVNYWPINVYKIWFNELNKEFGKPAILIHIDCDLYSSTKEALNFMLRNGLIIRHTLIAYDEFSVEVFKSEKHAHEEVFANYITKEVWCNIYYDKNTGHEIRQSLFEVI